ncbi:hypothetical protein KKD62_02100 [Patescibacteria group bacterium]|nr:hypothetical protein [Patescibacteria group bacterium]MBU1931204.1 hypothetical protein [Patescibacteria group bacterium]
MKKLQDLKFNEHQLIKNLVTLMVSWRLLLFIFQVTAMGVLAFKRSFPYVKELLKPFGQAIFWQWANFDGVHYLTIVQQGYLNTGFIQAFFPLYPLGVRYLTAIWQNYLVSGLLLSHLCFLAALAVFYKLLRLDYSANTSFKSLVFLICFPTSFYFAAFYSESLFLLLVLLSFWLMRQKRWLVSAICISLASATRLVGLFLIPALIWEFWQVNKLHNPGSKLKSLKMMLAFLIAPTGWLAYSLYLKQHFGDFFLYAHVQGAYGAQRTSGKIILLYQVFWRYLKMLLTVQKNSWVYYTVVLEFLAGAGFLLLLLLAFNKKLRIRWSYLFYALPAYLLPTLTGTFSSMPRYVLTLFPAFIVLGSIKNSRVLTLLLFFFLALLWLSTALFTQGYWIG